VGRLVTLRADWQSAQTARVNNPRAGCHPAPQNSDMRGAEEEPVLKKFRYQIAIFASVIGPGLITAKRPITIPAAS